MSCEPGMDQLLLGKRGLRQRVPEVTGQDWSSEAVALSLEDWELGRVALGCRMATDLLCQEMRDTCWDSTESLAVPERFSCGTFTAIKPLSHRGRAVTIKERNVVREIKGEAT